MAIDYFTTVSAYSAILTNFGEVIGKVESYSFPEQHLFSLNEFTRYHNEVILQIGDQINKINEEEKSIVKNKRWHDNDTLRQHMDSLQRRKGLLTEIEHDLDDALAKLIEISKLKF